MGDRDEWKRLASSIGFEFKEGIGALLESESLQRMAAAELHKGGGDPGRALKMLQNPILQGLLAKVFLGVARGKWRDYEFFIFRSSESHRNHSTTYYVNVAGLFKKDLQCDLEVTPAGWFDRLVRKIFSGSYVRLPENPELDDLISAKARDRSRARVYLADRNVQAVLLELYRSPGVYRVTDHGIRYKEPGRIMSPEAAQNVMDRIAGALPRF